MMEKGKTICLEMDAQQVRQYVIEQAENGRIILVACGPETPEIQQLLLAPRAADAGEKVVGVADGTVAAPARNRAALSIYAEKWLESVRPQVKESTYMKYWNLLYSYIIPELGGVEWGVLNRETVELFCGRMRSAGGQKKDGLSAKTVTDIMTVLRRICMFTGLRLGEICALKWEDISFSEHTLYVHRTMQRIQTKDDPKRKTKIIVTPPKSGRSVRRIPIPAELEALLSACRGERKGYILTGREDAFVEPRTMERHFAKVLEQAGVRKVNFHALRHTCTTIFVYELTVY